MVSTLLDLSSTVTKPASVASLDSYLAELETLLHQSDDHWMVDRLSSIISAWGPREGVSNSGTGGFLVLQV
jgi:hypothetical protein